MAECCSVGESGKQAPAVMSCPESGTHSKRVDLLTVRSLVRHLPLGMPDTPYYYCTAPACDVVYFPYEVGAPMFRRADLLVRVWSKEQGDGAPICYCFGFSKQDILQEIATSGTSNVSEKVKREVQAGHCACEVKNPSGKCCLGDVTRVEREARGQRT